MEPDAVSAWAHADLALTLLAVDPSGLGGLCLRARSGPVRDAVAARAGLLPMPQARIAPGIGDDQLFGGLDLAATFAARAPQRRAGLLETAQSLVLPMAERLRPDVTARLTQTMDARALPVLALDEGIEDELPAALQDRLAFRVDLSDVAISAISEPLFSAEQIAEARERLSGLARDDDQISRLAVCAAQFGIDSLRALGFALRAARAHAALWGHDIVDEDDLLIAAELVLAHRATQLPAPEEAPAEDPPPPSDDQADDPSAGEDDLTLPEDLLLEAVRAALPPGLLDKLADAKVRRGAGSGSGARRKGNRRGRPLPARPGRLDGSARIDLIATLRAAAPWQTIRRANPIGNALIQIRPSDIHIKRFESKSDRLLIFTVDASGSAALARLAEAKGAVELLLAEAYARRDHVALIAFRGTGAELLLPPTRSLVQTKRRLAALPGGGGTPLASGLRMAMDLAIGARGKGLTPTVALLTDGRANIALDGSPNRKQAAEDAQAMARALLAHHCDAIVIDVGNRPEPALQALSKTIGGPYLALPRADARKLSQAVSTALSD